MIDTEFIPEQVNETIYYDALSQPIYDQTFFDPHLYNNYEYSSINNTISDPCQGICSRFIGVLCTNFGTFVWNHLRL